MLNSSRAVPAEAADAPPRRRIRYLYHVQWAGVAYFLLTVLLGVAAAYRPNNLLVWSFTALLAGVIVSGVVSGWMLMSLRVARLEPRDARVDQPLVIRYAVRNRARFWPLFDVQLGEAKADDRLGWQHHAGLAAAWLLHAGPGEHVHAEAVLLPRRRGRCVLEAVEATSGFPFGLLRKTLILAQRAEVLVFPRMLELRRDLLRDVVPRGAGGVRTSSRPGPGEDFLGVREYRPGDSLRQVAWKRRAGLDELVTIERSTPSPPRLRVVLDLTRPTASLRVSGDPAEEGRALEESAISIAASVAALAEQEGFEFAIDVEGFDCPRTPLRRGWWHLQKVLAVLASLDLDAPRTPASRPDRDERCAALIIHPDRVDTVVDRPGAIHLPATRLAEVLAPGASA